MAFWRFSVENAGAVVKNSLKPPLNFDIIEEQGFPCGVRQEGKYLKNL